MLYMYQRVGYHPVTLGEYGGVGPRLPATMTDQIHISRWRRWRGAELLCAGLIVVLSAVGGSVYLYRYVTSVGYAYKISTHYFAPCALYALGREFQNPFLDQVPGLQDFMNEQTQTFTLAPDAPVGTLRDLSWFQRDHLYLLAVVALVWRVLGVSWAAFKLVPLIAYVISGVLLFFIFRLGARRSISLAAALLFLFSPAVLTILPGIRDFCKAPFFLGVFLILLYLTKHAVSSRRFWTLSGLMGALIAAGYGFRTDLIICIPPAAIAILWVARGKTRLDWKRRAAGLAVFAAAFLVFGAPLLLRSYGDGSDPTHHIICGIATECDRDLGIQQGSYEHIYYFFDAYTHAIANSYGHRIMGIKENIGYLSPLSGTVQNHYLRDMVLRFPGDMAARALSATLRILGNGMTRVTAYDYPDTEFVQAASALWRPLGTHLERFKFVYAGLALLLLAAHSLRTGAVAFLLMMYFTSYACAQFHLRHYFHLTFISLWFCAFLAELLVRVLCWMRVRDNRRALLEFAHTPARWWAAPAKRMLAFACGALLVLVGPLEAARAVQRYRVAYMLEKRAEAERVPLATDPEPDGDWTLHRLRGPLLSPMETDGEQVYEVQSEYLVAEFKPSAAPRRIRVQYDSETDFNDFTYELLVDAGGTMKNETVRYIFPVYQALYTTVSGVKNPFPGFDGRWGRSEFVGIAMPSTEAGDLLGLCRFTDLSSFPLLMNMTTTASNADFRYFQRLQMFSRDLPPRPMPKFLIP